MGVRHKLKMETNKQTKIIIALAILLVVTFCYMGINKYNDVKQNKQLEIYQEGVQYGFEQTIIQIAQMAVTCEQVPLRIENQTINMVAVDCLQ